MHFAKPLHPAEKEFWELYEIADSGKPYFGFHDGISVSGIRQLPKKYPDMPASLAHLITIVTERAGNQIAPSKAYIDAMQALEAESSRSGADVQLIANIRRRYVQTFGRISRDPTGLYDEREAFEERKAA